MITKTILFTPICYKYVETGLILDNKKFNLTYGLYNRTECYNNIIELKKGIKKNNEIKLMNSIIKTENDYIKSNLSLSLSLSSSSE